MSKKIFSEEEVSQLRANPHVESATKRSISFTPSFKQKVYDELMNGAGIRPRIVDLPEEKDLGFEWYVPVDGFNLISVRKADGTLYSEFMTNKPDNISAASHFM